jgi:hypothetical protein
MDIRLIREFMTETPLGLEGKRRLGGKSRRNKSKVVLSVGKYD